MPGQKDPATIRDSPIPGVLVMRASTVSDRRGPIVRVLHAERTREQALVNGYRIVDYRSIARQQLRSTKQLRQLRRQS